MRSTTIILIGATVLSSLIGCKKDLETDQSDKLQAASSFDYSTSGAVQMNLIGRDNLANSVFEIYTANPDQGGKKIGKAKFDEGGDFDGAYQIPHMLTSVYFKSLSIGLPSMDVPVHNGRVQYDLAAQAYGKNGQSINPVTRSIQNIVYGYLGGYNALGVPNYLTTPDVVTSSFLADMSASLPENVSVPNSRPYYMATATQSEILMHDSGDVWITFIHEGASYLNTLAYFVYNQSNPPQSVNDIDSVHVIYPNVSYPGTGGGNLQTGDKVYLGKFAPGEVIGWVLIQRGFENASTNGGLVDFTKTKFFSNPDFNPEPTANLRRHNVLLWDNVRELMILGFEDIERDKPNCDDDFNDALFYITASPTSSIYNPGIPRYTDGGGCPDSDNDGVNDCQDDFPNDPKRAFKVYTPYEGGFTSIGFEDLWPSKGDFDFNDLLLDINYMHVTSAKNQLVDLEYTSVVRHIGAAFNNGFGIEFPLSSSNLQGVTGPEYDKNYVSNTASGVEAGQSNAVVVFFDSARAHLHDTMEVKANLASTVSFAEFVVAGLNPFCISNEDRGREIHLKGRPGTDLANPSFFGLNDDVTDGVSVWYESDLGEPWAISVSHDYAPPVERVNIDQGYLKWSIWVNTGGVVYPDWYQNDPGYRDPTKLQ